MILKIIMWIISIIFTFTGLIGFLAQDPLPAFSLLLFGLIVNPRISDKLKNVHSIFSKKWFKPAAFILCMFLFISSIDSAYVNDTYVNKDNFNNNETAMTQINTELPEEKPSDNLIPNVVESAKLIVNFIDVGQADSIFIELPNNKTMLIDAGNNEDDETVINYIKNLNYDTINYVVGTHPHEDHIGGLDTVINTFNVENIYMPKIQHNTATFEDVLFAIQNKGLEINTAKAGTSILNIDNLNIDILAPVNDSYEELNNYSAVVKITYGNKSLLFTGDAESLSENEITADLKADILKLGHHGSDTSTSREFLSKVKPTYAVISVGKDNSYGHPSNDVLALLDEFNVNIFRTDEQGTIIARSDGNMISINKEPTPYNPNAPPSIQTVTTNEPEVAEEPVIDEEAPAIEEPKEVTVYVTKTGAKYHRDGCQYLRKSQIAISLNNATLQGYTPCSKCSPP